MYIGNHNLDVILTRFHARPLSIFKQDSLLQIVYSTHHVCENRSGKNVKNANYHQGRTNNILGRLRAGLDKTFGAQLAVRQPRHHKPGAQIRRLSIYVPRVFTVAL